MALTKVSTDGVKDDAITKTKIPANQIEASELADNAVDTNAIADQAVSLSKLPHGTSSNDGKFLRANNGADPSFETVSIPAGTTINNNADNRLITGSGSANTLNGESLLTYDGNNLNVLSGAHDSGLAVEAANANQETRIQIKAKASDDTNHIFQFNVKRSANRLDIVGGNAVRASFLSTGEVGIGTTLQQSLFQVGGGTNITNTKATVHVAPSSGNAMMSLRGGSPTIYFDGTGGGNAKFLTDGTDLTISNGTLDSAGTERFRFRALGGICFNGDNAEANALDDYEEGTFTATCSNGVTLHSSQDLCTYTRIGRQVTVRGQVRVNDENGGNQDFIIDNLPFVNQSGDGEGSSSTVGAVRIWDQNIPSNAIDVVCLVDGNDNDLDVWINRDDAGAERMKANANAYVLFTVSYFAN